MALVLYSQYLVFPNGLPAANYPVPVQLMGSNQPAVLFSDANGTTAGSNPVMTDGDGRVEFYAAPGCYHAHLAGEEFPVPIDESVTDPVWPDLVVHEQSVPSAVWSVSHWFGMPPTVDVVTAEGVTATQVDHDPDGLGTVITFGTAVTGTAYLRR